MQSGLYAIGIIMPGGNIRGDAIRILTLILTLTLIETSEVMQLGLVLEK